MRMTHWRMIILLVSDSKGCIQSMPVWAKNLLMTSPNRSTPPPSSQPNLIWKYVALSNSSSIQTIRGSISFVSFRIPRKERKSFSLLEFFDFNPSRQKWSGDSNRCWTTKLHRIGSTNGRFLNKKRKNQKNRMTFVLIFSPIVSVCVCVCLCVCACVCVCASVFVCACVHCISVFARHKKWVVVFSAKCLRIWVKCSKKQKLGQKMLKIGRFFILPSYLLIFLSPTYSYFFQTLLLSSFFMHLHFLASSTFLFETPFSIFQFA